MSKEIIVFYHRLDDYLKNLSLTSFTIINILLVAMFFFRLLLPVYVQLLLFMLPPMLCFALSIKNERHNYYLLVILGMLIWIIGLIIFHVIEDKFLGLDLSVFIVNTNMVENLFRLLIFSIFALIGLLLVRFAYQGKKPITALVFIPVGLLMFADGLFGHVLSSFMVIAMTIWLVGMLFHEKFLKNYTINIGIGVILLVGFELLSHHENQQSEQIAKMFLIEVEDYHRIHDIYPHEEKEGNDNKVIYHMVSPYDKTIKPYPVLYWRDHKNPYCRHQFDFEKRAWYGFCSD